MKVFAVPGARTALALSVVWAGITLTSAACAQPGRSAPQPSPSPLPVARTLSLDPALEKGRSLFISKGCANCHGPNLEFLVVVNLPEIREAAIMQQVRSPTGMMRGFPPSELSDEELEAIADFVAAVLSQRSQSSP